MWRRLPLGGADPHIGPMAEPLTVKIPHRLGRDEALHRIKSGFAGARAHFAHLITISEESWQDNRLTFHARALGQSAQGLLDVHEDCVVVSVELSWLLAQFALVASKVIKREGTLLLEKK
jgi:hypothetical protein